MDNNDLAVVEIQYNDAIEELYMRDKRGNQVQKFADDAHNLMVEQINDSATAVLHNILADTEQQARQAAELAKDAMIDPSSWLTTSELAAADQRERFVREDLADMTPEQIMDAAILAVKNRDKPLAWLILRYADKPKEKKAAHDWQLIEPGLRAFVIPEKVTTAAQRSQQLALAAEEKRVKAKLMLHKLKGKQAGPFNPFS